MIGIYKITSPSSKTYIGQSINIEKRIMWYKRLRCKSQKKLYNSFIKYGVDAHNFEIIEECDILLLNERERYWQDYYDVLNNGLNLRLTSTNDRSGKMSKESIIKMSESAKGNNSGSANKGRKNKIKWYKHSTETKLKMSNSHNKHTSKLVLNVENGIYYNSIKDAAATYGYISRNLARYLNGTRRKNTNLIFV